jgi:dTDP-4-amino-4,6-dideoxygalactose transaminase
VSSPASDIPLFRVFLPPRDELMPALEQTLYSGQISIGPPVEEFERAFAEAFGLPRACAVSSGTAGLHLALLLAGAGEGDEVISTAMTAEPTNLAIRHAGARVVWADVDPRNGNISPADVAALVGPRTRAIVAVDYGGIPVDLGALRRIADDHGVPLIEDAAHALGARFAGAPVGTHGDYVVFSLQAIKHMTTVDGGILVCRNADDDRRARLLRWFGIDRAGARTEVDVEEVGFKYNMNNVTATMGLVALRHIGPAIERHVANGRFLDAALADAPGVELCTWTAEAEPSYWFYTVLAERRDDLARHLASHGVAAGTVHARNDRLSVFAGSRRPLPALDGFSTRYLHLPCGWWVGDDDRERIADLIRRGW